MSDSGAYESLVRIWRTDQALLAKALDLLVVVIEPAGDCWFDHNGDCQAHYIEHPCRIAQARAFLTIAQANR